MSRKVLTDVGGNCPAEQPGYGSEYGVPAASIGTRLLEAAHPLVDPFVARVVIFSMTIKRRDVPDLVGDDQIEFAFQVSDRPVNLNIFRHDTLPLSKVPAAALVFWLALLEFADFVAKVLVLTAGVPEHEEHAGNASDDQ